jgi:hypothetical protein
LDKEESKKKEYVRAGKTEGISRQKGVWQAEMGTGSIREHASNANRMMDKQRGANKEQVEKHVTTCRGEIHVEKVKALKAEKMRGGSTSKV